MHSLVAGGSISDEDWTRHQCINIGEHNQESFYLFFPPVLWGSTPDLWTSLLYATALCVINLAICCLGYHYFITYFSSGVIMILC